VLTFIIKTCEKGKRLRMILTETVHGSGIVKIFSCKTLSSTVWCAVSVFSGDHSLHAHNVARLTAQYTSSILISHKYSTIVQPAFKKLPPAYYIRNYRSGAERTACVWTVLLRSAAFQHRIHQWKPSSICHRCANTYWDIALSVTALLV